MSMEEGINIMWSNKDHTKKYYILPDSMVNHYPELLEDTRHIPLINSDTFFFKRFVVW